ncbi:zinc finger protein 516-like isoform 1-T5 [Spinachia spinachia]
METEEREDESQNLTVNIKGEAADETSGHTCGVCGRSFPLLSSLSQHMRRHTREKPYKCPYCEHRTAQKGSLKAHIRSHKLGLFSHDLSDQGGAGTREQKDDPETPDPPETVSESDKAQDVTTKVKKKGTKKKVKGKDAMALGDGADDGCCTCSICGQDFPQVLLLKSHMKRHRNSQDHGCRICGRRFRQAWFLQSHMRIHRVKAQLRGSNGDEPPATINGVPQDPASLTNEECLFELCAGCGNFFNDRKTLRTHEKLHKPSHGRTATPPEGADPSELHAAKRQFLESLSLTRAGPRETSEDRSAAARIPELDPICSYQAWQLATRGRLVEATEKCLGWEERLADAEVAFDTEKGEYVPLKQEKKRKQADTSSSNMKKVKGETGPEHPSNGLTHTKGGDKKISQKERILLNGLGHAFYEALQTKKVKDVHLTPKRSNSNRSQDQEDKKTYFCEHCDFHTVDAALLKSHLQGQHQDFLGPHSKLGLTVDHSNQSGSKASRYMDYLRNRSLLLSQTYWNPYTCTPGPASVASHIKTEKSNGAEVKEQGHTTDAGSLLNLSSLPVSEGEASVAHPKKTEGLVRHQCPYCSHTTNYPEVLWIHQRVAHRVDGSSSMAPKWAPCINSNKSLKGAGTQWRRTGPPPFLEGKDCPALPAPRTQRTQPPGLTASSSTSSKNSASKTQPKSKPQPKDARSSDGTQASGRTGALAQKKSVEHNRAQKVGSKGSSTRATSSSSIVHSKGSSSFQPTDSPKAGGHRAPVEANFPQEGLGFMLARNHGGASSNVSADRPHSRRQACDSSSGPKGPDLWAAMNMWGHKAYMEPVRFAQVKNDSTGDVPMDILSLLKNYSPHDLAAVYQHWGFVDPRIDPQAMLQLNGNFGKEVHSTTEASKQVNSRSTSSSGSLHKGT